MSTRKARERGPSKPDGRPDIRQLIDSIYAVNCRLAKAVKDDVSQWNPAVKEHAEQALAGGVHRGPDGQWTRFNFDRPDWNGHDTSNPAHMIMVLRRFHVLSPLQAGYRATADERYAQGARRYIEAFLRDNPPVEDWVPAPGDGDTEYDIRLGVWLVALGEFRNSPAFDDEFKALMIEAVRGNLRYLTGHVRADRNIRFHHGLVLLLSGLRLAKLPEAGAWLKQGIEILNDGVRRQILPDGAHMEATPGYHGGVLRMVEMLWKVARAFPELKVHVPAERVAAMHDYILCATRPDGAEISLHDSRYVAAVLKPHTEVADARAAFRREAGLPEQLPEASTFFPHANQAFIRDDWTAGATYLTFDAATRRSFHWHPSRNSITLFANGRALLVDPGYTFETQTFPRYGHRTAHHTTVNFNGLDQSQSRGAVQMAKAEGYTLVQGLYGGGYWPVENHSHGTGVFGEHQRTLLWIHGRFGVVLDHIHHTGTEGHKPAIESCWQLSEGPAECDASARRVVTRHAQGNLALFFPLVLAGTTMTVHEGEREPMRGWLPIEWGQTCIPAPLIRLTAAGYDSWHGDMASVLVPFAGATPPRLDVQATGPDAVHDSRLAGCLRLAGEGGKYDLVIWTRRLGHAIGRQHGLNTDAGLVHLRMSASGAVEDGLMVDGTTCEFEGAELGARLKCAGLADPS